MMRKDECKAANQQIGKAANGTRETAGGKYQVPSAQVPSVQCQMTDGKCRLLYAEVCLTLIALFLGLSSAFPARGALPDAVTATGLTSNDVRALACEDKQLYVGTWGGGLCIYDSVSKTWKAITRRDGLLSNNITAVCVANGELWVGTDKGLCYFDGKARRWQYFGSRNILGHNRVTALLWDGRFVWVGTEGGLSRYDTRHQFWATTVKEHGLPSDHITCLARDPSRWGYKDIWVGTKAGLVAYDLKLRYLDMSEYKPREVEESQTWAVARYLRPTEISYQLGPLSNEIRDIVIQDEVVWVVSRFGISYFDRGSMTRLFPPPWRSYVYDKEWNTWMTPTFYMPSLMTVGNIRNIELSVADQFKSKYPYQNTIIPERAWDEAKREEKKRVDEERKRALEEAMQQAKYPPIAEDLTDAEKSDLARVLTRREADWMKAHDYRHPYYLLDTFRRSYVKCILLVDKDVCFIANDRLYLARIAFEAREMAWKKGAAIERKGQSLLVQSACADEAGTIWIGTDRGVWAYPGKGKVTQVFEAVDVAVEALEDTLSIIALAAIDHDVWAARSNYEIAHYDHRKRAWSVEGRLSDLPDNIGLKMGSFDGTAYIIAENGQSFRWGAGGWRAGRIHQISSKWLQLKELIVDDQELWFVAGWELGRLVKGKRKASVYRVSQPLSSLCKVDQEVDQEVGQEVWAVGASTLFRYDRKNDSFSEMALDTKGEQITGLIGHNGVL